ncbi:unnamed protein product, partial [marine sediment metagenome]
LASQAGVIGDSLKADGTDYFNVTYVFDDDFDYSIQFWLKTVTTGNWLFGSTISGAGAATHYGLTARVNDNNMHMVMNVGGSASGVQG